MEQVTSGVQGIKRGETGVELQEGQKGSRQRDPRQDPAQSLGTGAGEASGRKLASGPKRSLEECGHQSLWLSLGSSVSCLPKEP